MQRYYKYFKHDNDRKFNIDAMKKYVKNKQELDKYFEKVIGPYIINNNLLILDACCGIGHNLFFLNKISPGSTFIGIDQTAYLLDEARRLCFNNKNISFEIGDIYDLSSKYLKKFDISINWKTISWLPYYDQLIKSLVEVTNKYIFISSLFYDGDIDFEIRGREFKKESARDGFNAYYNVYSFPHFKEFVYSLGAKNIEAFDFEIGIDISKPPIDQMGTYTLKLENGKRLQISGAVVMSWKIIKIDL